MKSQLKRYLGSLVFVFLLCLAIALGATAGVLFVYNSDLPQVNSLEDYHPSLITEVYSDDGHIIGSFALERRVIVTWDKIPQVVKDAITSRLLRTELTGLAASSDGTFDGTICLAMKKPQFEFTGTATRLRFKFVDVDVTLFFDINSLLSGGSSSIEGSTAQSFVQTYVTDPALLVEPRFKPVRSAEFDGQQTFEESIRLRGGVAGIEQAAYTTEIVDSTGFNSDVLKRAFEPGKLLKATFSSSQEFKSTVKVSATVSRRTVGTTRIYFDKVFKTFVIANRSS